MNIIVVLGSSRINAELTKRFGKETTSLGEPIHVVQLDKSEGVVDRDEQWLQQTRDAVIKEYFFGDSKTTLSPFTHTLDFEDLVIYKAPECASRKSPQSPSLSANGPRDRLYLWR